MSFVYIQTRRQRCPSRATLRLISPTRIAQSIQSIPVDSTTTTTIIIIIIIIVHRLLHEKKCFCHRHRNIRKTKVSQLPSQSKSPRIGKVSRKKKGREREKIRKQGRKDGKKERTKKKTEQRTKTSTIAKATQSIGFRRIRLRRRRRRRSLNGAMFCPLFSQIRIPHR